MVTWFSLSLFSEFTCAYQRELMLVIQWCKLFLLALMTASLVSPIVFARDTALGRYHHLYVSDRRLVTVEVINPNEVILNYINLGDSFEFIEAPMLLLLDRLNHSYHGQVMEIENPPDPSERFKVSQLINPGQFVGFKILGNYRFKAPPRAAFLKVGSRIIELQTLSPGEFELVAQRIDHLDLSLQARRRMLMESGFREGQGLIHNSGTLRAEQLEEFFPSTELIAPVMLSSPMPKLPAEFSDLSDPVTLLVSAMVSQSGDVHNLKVAEGINPKLDQLAIDVIGNSWTFLPAISGGKIASVELTLKIIFQRN